MTIRTPSLSEPRSAASHAAPQDAASAWLRHGLAGVGGVAILAMLSLPGARSVSHTFGWMPLWLLALPAVAWLALWLLRERSHGVVRGPAIGRRRGGPQVQARWLSRPASNGLAAGRKRAA